MAKQKSEARGVWEATKVTVGGNGVAAPFANNDGPHAARIGPDVYASADGWGIEALPAGVMVTSPDGDYAVLLPWNRVQEVRFRKG